MQSLKVSDVMWNHIEPIRRGTPLTKVVKTLLHNHVTGLPVVDDHRKVIGFVSDLAQNLGAGKPKVYPVVDHDRLIGIVTRTAILAEFAKAGYGIEVPKYA